jgi:HSP20 family protein
MALTHYRPGTPAWTNFPRLTTPNRIGRLFDDVFGAEMGEGMGWSPVVDIMEIENELIITAELPGMKKEDVSIEVNDAVLTIRGEKKVEKEQKEVNYRLVERSFGSFERVFTLPRSIDASNIKAEFEDGVLQVHLPKTPQAQGRRIDILQK